MLLSKLKAGEYEYRNSGVIVPIFIRIIKLKEHYWAWYLKYGAKAYCGEAKTLWKARDAIHERTKDVTALMHKEMDDILYGS